MRLPSAVLLLLALGAPRDAHAQFRDQLFTITPAESPAAPPYDARVPSARPAEPRVASQDGEGRHPVWLALGGAAGGALGLVVGGIAGAAVDGSGDDGCIDFCFGPGLVGGVLLGESVGIALGVHMANGRRGSLPMGVLTSLGILATGLFIGQDAPNVILLIPVGQLFGTMNTERSTGARP